MAHVTITNGALSLNTQGIPAPACSNLLNLDLTVQGPPLPHAYGLQAGSCHPTGMLSGSQWWSPPFYEQSLSLFD